MVRSLHIVLAGVPMMPARPDSGPLPAVPTLDRDIFGSITLLADRRPDFANRIIARYIEQSRRALEELSTAVIREDFDTARLVAHKLKGSSRQIGASRLSELCERVLRACERSDAETVRRKMPAVIRTHAETLQALLAVEDLVN